MGGGSPTLLHSLPKRKVTGLAGQAHSEGLGASVRLLLLSCRRPQSIPWHANVGGFEKMSMKGLAHLSRGTFW